MSDSLLEDDEDDEPSFLDLGMMNQVTAPQEDCNFGDPAKTWVRTDTVEGAKYDGRWCDNLSHDKAACENAYTYKNCDKTKGKYTVYFKCAWSDDGERKPGKAPKPWKKCHAAGKFTCPSGNPGGADNTEACPEAKVKSDSLLEDDEDDEPSFLDLGMMNQSKAPQEDCNFGDSAKDWVRTDAPSSPNSTATPTSP
jgi:hypothetical protein